MRPSWPGSIAAAAVAIAASAADTGQYRVVSLADGIHAIVYDAELEPDGNALVIVNDEDVVVVDTHTGPTAARRTIAEIKRLTPRPVRYVVNTHWHDDHVFGNHEYATAFPGVQFIAHPSTREDIAARGYPNGDAIVEQLLASAKRYDDALSAGKTTSGAPITSDLQVRYEVLRAKLKEVAADRRTLQPELPTVLVDATLTLARGDREIVVTFLGRGNTRGDVVVHLPRERILATGDLIVAPVPFATEVYPKEWVATLARLIALDAATIVPGHGPVMRDWTYARKVRDALTATIDGVTAARQAGLTLEQTIEQVQLDEVRDGFLQGVETRRGGYEAYFRPPLIRRIWQELDGALK